MQAVNMLEVKPIKVTNFLLLFLLHSLTETLKYKRSDDP